MTFGIQTWCTRKENIQKKKILKERKYQNLDLLIIDLSVIWISLEDWREETLLKSNFIYQLRPYKRKSKHIIIHIPWGQYMCKLIEEGTHLRI